jgi:hypothetical protein
MTSTATRAANQNAKAAAAQLPTPPTHDIVAASGGSRTTSREPPGQSAVAPGAEHAATNGKPAVSRKPPAAAKTARPPARFAAVSSATRISELAKWIAVRPTFTFADAAGASAPSPCSPTVMAYTLPDPRLASALAELGYLVTAGGKNGYTVTAIMARSGGHRSPALRGS